MRGVVAKTRGERRRLAAGLAALGLTPVPSATNFVLFRVPGSFGLAAEALRERLESKSVVVRSAADHGLPGCLRATAGLPEETDRLLAAIRDAAR
jgi:histidinol-phosphate aminotransferase